MVHPVMKYVTQAWDILNLKGYPNCMTGSKLRAILLDGWILPPGGAASGRVAINGATPSSSTKHTFFSNRGKKVHLIHYKE